MQAGSLSGKSRSSQTPCPSTPCPNRGGPEGAWDLLRTQSLPADSQEWLSAIMGNETVADFGHAAAEYALTVSEYSSLMLHEAHHSCQCLHPHQANALSTCLLLCYFL